MSKLIGRVLATEKSPTTIDEFHFWTNSDFRLHAFDVVKVEHLEEHTPLALLRTYRTSQMLKAF